MRAIPPAQSATRLLSLLILLFLAVPPWSVAQAETAPYVGAWEADTQAAGITREDMDLIRSKKTLYLSKSFGMYTVRAVSGILGKNEGDLLYLKILENGKFNYTGVGENKRPVLTGTENAWADYSLQHFIYEFEPLWQRLLDLEYAVDYYNERLAPDHLDAVIVNWVNARDLFREQAELGDRYPHQQMYLFDRYKATMERLEQRHPHTRFIYVTVGVYPYNPNAKDQEEENARRIAACAFSDHVIRNFKGIAPLLDLRDLLSTPLGQPGQPKCGTEGAGPGCYMCDAFHMPGSEHFDYEDIKKRMGYALLLMLKKLYTDDNGCPHNTAPSRPTGLRAGGATENTVSLQWTPATPPDGCKVDFYNILRNDTVVGISRTAGYLDSGLSEQTSYRYAVTAVTRGKDGADHASPVSGSIQVLTSGDVTPPSLEKVPDTEFEIRITAFFNERLDPSSIGNTGNYTITPAVGIVSAELSDNGSEINLTVAPLSADTRYSLTVVNVRDANGNAVADNNTAGFRYLPGSADMQIIRNILDVNGWKKTPVAQVSTFEGDRIVALNLSDMNIKTLAPAKGPGIGNLTALRRLDIHGHEEINTSLLTLLPEEIGNCAALTEITLCANQLVSVPSTLGRLKGLVRLDISFNALTSLPDGLDGLVDIQRLNLEKNRFCDPSLMSAETKAWADKHNPGWSDPGNQICGPQPPAEVTIRNVNTK